MKVLCLIACLLAVVSYSARDAGAVIFASDTYYLYEDGARVEDNSVLMRGEDGTVDVCVGGKFEYRQNMPRIVMLYITDDPDIPAQSEWLASVPGQGKNRQDYEAFLEERARKCLFSTKAILPERTNYETYDIPESGMTGGRIGEYREFMLDIVDGKTQPVKTPENSAGRVKEKGAW